MLYKKTLEKQQQKAVESIHNICILKKSYVDKNINYSNNKKSNNKYFINN